MIFFGSKLHQKQTMSAFEYFILADIDLNIHTYATQALAI